MQALDAGFKMQQPLGKLFKFFFQFLGKQGRVYFEMKTNVG